MKQIAVTFVVPAIVVCCIVVWVSIWTCCAKKCGVASRTQAKDFLIVSIVLLLFLCYPMLVRFCLAALTCPRVGDTMYLMADLQEPCFHARHTTHLLLLTVPQCLLCVVGMPLSSGLLIMRTQSPSRWAALSDGARDDFNMRFGFLFSGFRRERGWWETVIAARKAAVVVVGAFGSQMGTVARGRLHFP